MQKVIDCSNCHTTLHFPPGAISIRCAICRAITHVAAPRSIPAPQFYYNNNHSISHHLHPYAPAPYSGSVPWAPAPPSAQGSKKAVICGISYKGSEYELKGCLNDAKCMKYMLVNRFHFPESSILMLTDEETDPYKVPTKKNIRMAFYWLVQGCQAGDSLVFHYSGHGGQQKDENGDEIDGFDETILPVDFEEEGMIIDDEINETIVNPLPRGAKLHAIVDACHSGTVLDLPFLCKMTASGQYSWEDHRPKNGQNKGTSGGEVFCFSGCDDNQTSADTVAMSKDTSTGAMTFSFIQAIEEGQAATYGTLINSMKATIRNANLLAGAGRVASILTLLLHRKAVLQGLRQEPQLTANEPFDVYAKPFSL
ncbi:metacaspase-1-like isoform X1 [Carex littledalei]|uniref:Metacaspase-1-like isoform X1 n=1 Tax=Carex littledalei TaxID=544730 RepID=A0A833VGB2_9POAL|nr:metacaspase-1-like isoform X1 [Carex littledalei]